MRYLMIAVMVVCVLPMAARADWDLDPDNPDWKMHYPQLPDPEGWDVNFAFPNVLADDWRCTETGPVADVHFWFSSHQDVPFEVLSIQVRIYADVPAASPEELLWTRDFALGEFSIRYWGQGEQGYYDPVTGEFITGDHSSIYQANIIDIERPFFQEVDSIYWLGLSVTAEPEAGGIVDPILGWKTSQDHWNDAAVWDAGGVWQPLADPITLEPLDLAFVITPEPATMGLLGAGLVGLVARRRRH